MAENTDLQAQVKQYILSEFLEGEDPSELEDTTPLISSGVIDSIGTLKLVTYLEEQFSISVSAHEADVDNLNTITDIVKLVTSKQAS
jgi:acyl carrier protein